VRSRKTPRSSQPAKGKAELQLGSKSAARANWSDVRKLFIQANKIDPEAPEPLALFYQSYAVAGEQPTKNAVDALMYALELVPQDSKLRLTAVHEFLNEGNTSTAQRYFGAFAFEPHSKTSIRQAAADAMAAMEQGRKNEALKDVGEIQKELEKDDD